MSVSAPVGLYEVGQVLGAEPEHPDDERVAVSHGDGRQKKHDRQLIPGKDNASLVADVVRVDTDRHHDVITVCVVVQCIRRALYVNTPVYYRHSACFSVEVA